LPLAGRSGAGFAIYLSAFCHARAAPVAAAGEIKTAAQEQLEYMLTKDDDGLLLAFNVEASLCSLIASEILFLNSWMRPRSQHRSSSREYENK
jgi:hypothetical protein